MCSLGVCACDRFLTFPDFGQGVRGFVESVLFHADAIEGSSERKRSRGF